MLPAFLPACFRRPAGVSSQLEGLYETCVADCFVLHPGRRRWRGAAARRRWVHRRRFSRRRRVHRRRFSRWRVHRRRFSRRRLPRRLRRLRRLLRRLRRLLLALFLLRLRAWLRLLALVLRLWLQLLSGLLLSRLPVFTECDRCVCAAGARTRPIHGLCGAPQPRHSRVRPVRTADQPAHFVGGLRCTRLPDRVPRSLDPCRRGLLGGGWHVALRHPGARTEAGPAEHRRPRPERATQPRAPHRLLASGIAVGSRPVGGIFAPAGRRGTAVYILMVA